ncbi:MAG: hypothetical protein KJ709_02885 [Nanoarchaeota archaeon]|nr:hypothetical protein [Nanoarchaeota archaeon]
MIVYNPHGSDILPERLKTAQSLLDQIPARHCFITGSFLYKQHYRDIDIFAITRSKKKIGIDNEKARIAILDFNDLHSLFYHSISKSCIAKNILPVKQLKATMADYWTVINEAIPTLLNNKDRFHKDVRFLVLYTEYLRTKEVLDTFELDRMIGTFKDYKEVIRYAEENVPAVIHKSRQKSYLKRYFYTQAGHYKDLRSYPAQNFLYGLAHSIIRGVANGQC